MKKKKNKEKREKERVKSQCFSPVLGLVCFGSLLFCLLASVCLFCLMLSSSFLSKKKKRKEKDAVFRYKKLTNTFK